jgi:hypothetical protein
MPRNGGGNTKRKQTHGTRGASWRAVTKARTMHVGDENSEATRPAAARGFLDGAKCQPWWPRHRATSRNLPTIPSVRSSADVRTRTAAVKSPTGVTDGGSLRRPVFVRPDVRKERAGCHIRLRPFCPSKQRKVPGKWASESSPVQGCASGEDRGRVEQAAALPFDRSKATAFHSLVGLSHRSPGIVRPCAGGSPTS